MLHLRDAVPCKVCGALPTSWGSDRTSYNWTPAWVRVQCPNANKKDKNGDLRVEYHHRKNPHTVWRKVELEQIPEVLRPTVPASDWMIHALVFSEAVKEWNRLQKGVDEQ